MIEGQALDHMVGRPGREFGRHVGRAFKLQRARAGQFDGASDPVGMLRRRLQPPHPEPTVQQDAKARIALGQPVDGLERQGLEGRDAFGIGADLAAQVLELAAVVHGQDRQLVGHGGAGGDPVEMLQLGVLAQAERALRSIEKQLQFFPGRHGRGAAVARDDDGPAGVAVFAAGLQRRVAQPAAQEAGHEGVAGAQDIIDLDAEAAPDHAVIEAGGNGFGEGRTSVGAALADQQGRAALADGAQGGKGVGRAAEDVDFFFRADDEVAQGQDLLQASGDGGVGDEAVLAHVLAGQAPKDRPVVDVEHHPPARRLDQLAGADRGVEHGRLRQVGAVDQHGAGRLEEGRVHVVGVQRHVGAVLAIEDQGEGVGIADAEEDQGRQPRLVLDHAVDSDALAGQLFSDETAEVIGADAGQKAGVQAQSRRADGRVGGAAADVFGEGGHVLQPPADLLAVQVHAGPAHRDQIKPRRGNRHSGSSFAMQHSPPRAVDM